MGAAKPQMLEIVPSNDRRTPSARDAARRTYQRLLERVLTRAFIGSKVDGFRSAMDLEHSFGPAYVRGRLLRGTAADAVIGVGDAESAAMIDGVLTLGILWLDYCRQHGDGRRHFGGLKVDRAGRSLANDRRANGMAQPQPPRIFSSSPSIPAARNLRPSTSATRAISNRTSCTRFRPLQPWSGARRGSIGSLSLVPEAGRRRVEVSARSASEVCLLLHGLEFARVRHGASSASFARENEMTFGAGANETPLTPENETLCRELFARLFQSRRPDGAHIDALFRLQPERWLESRVRGSIVELLAEPAQRSHL